MWRKLIREVGMREREFVQVSTKIVAAVEARPPDHYAFRATPELRTFAEEVYHISDVDFRLCGLAAGRQRPEGPETSPPDQKAGVVDRLRKSLDLCRSALAGLDDQSALEPTFGPYVRGRHVTAMLGHTWHEFGKLTVVLRLNGIAPPS